MYGWGGGGGSCKFWSISDSVKLRYCEEGEKRKGGEEEINKRKEGAQARLMVAVKTYII